MQTVFKELPETEKFLKRQLNLINFFWNPPRIQKWPTLHEVLLFKDGVRLLHFKSMVQHSLPTPVLLVYALINRPSILDFKKNKSVVEQLLKTGLDVYLVDWSDVKVGDSQQTLDQYVLDYLNQAVAYVSQNSVSKQVSLLGYCMGGTLSAIYAAVHPEKVKNLVLMAAPIDFHDEGKLNRWARSSLFDVDALTAVFPTVPPQMLQYAFLKLNPFQNIYGKWLMLWKNFHNNEAINDFFALERWLNDSIPFPGRAYRQWINEFYKGNKLIKGELKIGGRPIDLATIDCPLLLIVGESDDIVTPVSTLRAEDFVRSRDTTALRIASGHVGLVMSGAAMKNLWPEAGAWLAARSTAE